MPPRDTVLLLTHSGDHFTVERVAEALARRGARPFRLDTDLFPSETRLTARLGGDGLTHRIRANGESVISSEVRAVWARKLWPARLDERLGAEMRALCGRESAAALRAFLDGLGDARWVNPLAPELRADDKLLQLRLAREAGLDIPRTLLTNDAAEARRFFEETGGRMVAKLLRPLSASMGAAPLFVYTSDVTAEDLREAEQLRHCPSVFQERVEKERELRAAYVGGRLFVGALDARQTARGATDWRRAAPDECRWAEDSLPPGVAARLDALMRRLGLVYGAADFILTPDGRYVFLEVNPAGEWGMLERDLGLPIADALAEELLA